MVMIARRSGPGQLEVVQVDPEETARIRARRFRKRLLRNGTEWRGFWLFTFPKETMEGLEKQEMHRVGMACWRKLRARLWESGHRFKYVLVVEWTKAGRPHFHVLMDRYIPKAIVAGHWESLGGGVFLRAREIKNQGKKTVKQAINYICKYLTKCVERVKGCRRWAYTQKMLDKIEKTVSEWVVITKSDLLALNLENEIIIDNGRGMYDYWPESWVERSI